MFLLRDDISEITALLEKGGVICYPTDTIWGVGCDALNAAAVARVSEIKGGAPGNGYILLVSDLEMLKQYVAQVHPRIETLLGFHERPLTIVYERPVGLPDTVKAADGSAALRIASDQFCQRLIQSLGRPLLSTAACTWGAPYPATFGMISSEILGAVDYVVKHRREDKQPGEPSPIARLDRHKELEFIRE
jgi:L-threonylcarbamoyladenylate synthase